MLLYGPVTLHILNVPALNRVIIVFGDEHIDADYTECTAYERDHKLTENRAHVAAWIHMFLTDVDLPTDVFYEGNLSFNAQRIDTPGDPTSLEEEHISWNDRNDYSHFTHTDPIRAAEALMTKWSMTPAEFDALPLVDRIKLTREMAFLDETPPLANVMGKAPSGLDMDRVTHLFQVMFTCDPAERRARLDELYPNARVNAFPVDCRATSRHLYNDLTNIFLQFAHSCAFRDDPAAYEELGLEVGITHAEAAVVQAYFAPHLKEYLARLIGLNDPPQTEWAPLLEWVGGLLDGANPLPEDMGALTHARNMLQRATDHPPKELLVPVPGGVPALRIPTALTALPAWKRTDVQDFIKGDINRRFPFFMEGMSVAIIASIQDANMLARMLGSDARVQLVYAGYMHTETIVRFYKTVHGAVSVTSTIRPLDGKGGHCVELDMDALNTAIASVRVPAALTRVEREARRVERETRSAEREARSAERRAEREAAFS